jgi:hypothetical protein
MQRDAKGPCREGHQWKPHLALIFSLEQGLRDGFVFLFTILLPMNLGRDD